MHPSKELIEGRRDGASFASPYDFANRLTKDKLEHDEGRNDPMKGNLESRVTPGGLNTHGDLCKTKSIAVSADAIQQFRIPTTLTQVKLPGKQLLLVAAQRR